MEIYVETFLIELSTVRVKSCPNSRRVSSLLALTYKLIPNARLRNMMVAASKPFLFQDINTHISVPYFHYVYTITRAGMVVTKDTKETGELGI
jgi:hypothetical protein